MYQEDERYIELTPYSAAQTMGQQGQFRAATNTGRNNMRPDAKEEKRSRCVIM